MRAGAVVVALAALAMPAVGDGRTEPADEAAQRIAAGRKAVAEGESDAARHHFLSALAVAPDSVDAVGALLRLDEADAEARLLWTLHAALAVATDPRGKFTQPRSWPPVPREDLAFAQRVATLRAQAVDAAYGAASKCAGSGRTAVLQWLDDLAHVVEDGAPAYAVPHETAFGAARGKVAADRKAVVGALLRLAQTSVARDPQTALAAARLVRGLQGQEPAPKSAPAAPSDAARAALDVIERVRGAMRKEETAPPRAEGGAPPPDPPRKSWTVDELLAIESEAVPEWNREHADWSHPAVVTSPKGLYRIETTCGIATLVAVATNVETQHARLVRWIGADPFGGRQGTVRVCPDDADFESEGRPFWWAGGCQSGDLTTMIARFPRVDGIVGTLVHELTHRFDGKAFPGLPSWALEGRATYVASCARRIDSDELDERWVEWGRLWETQNRGYCRRKGFEELLRGTVADFRHNYDAGYSLWLFLTRFRGFSEGQQEAPLYAPQIPAWLRRHAKDLKTDPVERFAAAFADGRDGRAAELDALLAQFERFAGEGGSGARPPAAWKATWEGWERAAWEKLARESNRPETLYDAATWTPDRRRSDPPAPGEGRARRAAELLLANGQKSAALEALHWSLQADEPGADVWARAAEIEGAGGDAAAAWAARATAWRLRGGDVASVGAAPPSVSPAWRAAMSLATAYRDHAEQALAAGQRRVAAALRAEHDRIAEVLAVPLAGELPPVEGGDGAASAARPAPRAPELCPPRGLLAEGLVEERWAPLDSEPGMPWFQPAPDILELGRNAPAADVSGALRDAQTRKIAVRTRGWHTGTYTVRTRVRFVSAFAYALLVVGRTGRDRGVQLRLSGGDWAYATGAKDGSLQLSGVAWHLDDLRPWHDHVGRTSGEARFASPREVFDVEVVVSGPFVRVAIDGVPRGSFRRATGAPVEGAVVFGLRLGIVRFEEPAVQRHRVLGPDRASPEERFDEPLRLDRPLAFAWATAPGRRVEGVPADPRGTLLLWFPDSTGDDPWSRDSLVPKVDSVRASVLGPWASYPRAVALLPAAALAGPPSWGPDALDVDAVAGHAGHAGLAELVEAIESGSAAAEDWSHAYGTRPVWIALDASNVIRSCGPSGAPSDAASLYRSLAGR